ncbi:MAG: hypothetical protein ABSB19_03470 [Methylomonas sp.]
MDVTFLILVAVLFACIIIMMLCNEALRQPCVNALYILSGSIALYCLETADRSNPIYMTLLLVVLLCLTPMLVDGLLITAKKSARNRL